MLMVPGGCDSVFVLLTVIVVCCCIRLCPLDHLFCILFVVEWTLTAKSQGIPNDANFVMWSCLWVLDMFEFRTPFIIPFVFCVPQPMFTKSYSSNHTLYIFVFRLDDSPTSFVRECVVESDSGVVCV